MDCVAVGVVGVGRQEIVVAVGEGLADQSRYRRYAIGPVADEIVAVSGRAVDALRIEADRLLG